MKRFTTLLAGSALVAALSFGAQTPAAPSTDNSATTTKKHVKKHKKAKKVAAATTTATPSAPATSGAPAKK